MKGSKEPLTLIPFGPFEADIASQELRKQGIRLRLPRQSFQILKMLLERAGELVTREEMHQALWPSDTFVDFEHGLNAAINRLREALGDDADDPSYIETLPRRGYRFVGPMAQTVPVQVTVRVAEGTDVETAPESVNRKMWTVGLTVVGCCALLMVGAYWLRSPMAPARVVSYRQLSKDRQIKRWSCGLPTSVVTDGPRVFFSEEKTPLMQVSPSGDNAVKGSVPFPCFGIFDISPDKTELLGAPRANGSAEDQPLWVLSIASGLAHRLGNLNGHAGAWSPDGQGIAFVTGGFFESSNDVYIAAKDGGVARKLIRIEKGPVYPICWSPDGKKLRMTVMGKLWEVSADGTNLHAVELFPGEKPTTRWITGMSWTAGGKYFVFAVWKEDSLGADLWAVREKGSLGRVGRAKPVQLTTGATSFWSPAPSPDGKQIYAIGGQPRGELVRYDVKLHRLEPFLSGMSADQLVFSKDRNWVIYVTFPEGSLWRSKVDGSERMQLTSPGLRAATPSWSPDGTRIAFSGLVDGEAWKLYLVSAEGGKPEVVSREDDDQVDPTWTPDGKSLIFGRRMQSAQPRISSVDLQTGSVVTIPGSEGMFSPKISPDGRFIVATDAPRNHKLFLFDQETQKWSELESNSWISVAWPQWSRDSKTLYTTDFGDTQAPVFYRVRVSDRKIERVATVEVPEGLTGNWYLWMGVAPDGSPLLLRDLSIEEIYALDVELP